MERSFSSRRDPNQAQNSRAVAVVWDPKRYAKNAGFVPQLGAPAFDLLAPQAGERILDLGCGDGVLTEKLRAAGAKVTGIDSSRPQIEAAQARGLDAQVLDAAELGFDAEFDAVFSNAALHWIREPDRVITGVYRALKPGGRFVGEFGGKGNIGAIYEAIVAAICRRGLDPEAYNPWYYPDCSDYSAKLVASGFRVVDCLLIDRPTPLPGTLVAWLETFAQTFTAAVAPDERKAFLDEVSRSLAHKLSDNAGNWWADYVRIRFQAIKPEVG